MIVHVQLRSRLNIQNPAIQTALIAADRAVIAAQSQGGLGAGASGQLHFEGFFTATLYANGTVIHKKDDGVVTSGELGKVWMRGLCLASCLVLAGCMGSGSGDPDPDEGPDVIIDPGDDDDPILPDDDDDDDDDDDPIDVIADIVTDVVTTSVSVTTVTATGGS